MSTIECGCRYWVIACNDCDEPVGCPVAAEDFVATATEPSEELPVGIEVLVNIAGDYSALNPAADNMIVGQQFFTTIPFISFAAGTELIFSVTSLPRVVRGQFQVCGVDSPCCNTNTNASSKVIESVCPPDLYMGKVCPPPAPCEVIKCKEPLCCLNDGCNAGSVSAIPTVNLPVGTIIWIYLCRQEIFVKLVLRPGWPEAKEPVCGVISGSGCDLEITGSVASVGALSYQWYHGRQGDISDPVGLDQPTFAGPQADEHYWVRLRDDCGYCDAIEFLFVPSPPEITSFEPIGITNNTVEVEVVADDMGFGPLTYQWYEGFSGDISSPIAGEVASIYTITPPVFEIWIAGETPTAGLLVIVQIGGDYTLSGGTAGMVFGDTFIANGVALAVGLEVVYRNGNFWVRVTNSCGGTVDSPHTFVAPAIAEMMVTFGAKNTPDPEIAEMMVHFGMERQFQTGIATAEMMVTFGIEEN